MQTIMPGVTYRPLFPVDQMFPLPDGPVPTVLIFHTMDGFLDGSVQEWISDGVNGVCPHFNVAGSWDAPFHPDGWIEQNRPIDKQAAAQWSGNAYATSVETSDGAVEDKVGGWAPAWTDAQVASLIQIGVWWCTQTGNPPVLVSNPTDHGIGYHRQFQTWNQSNHACPGATREAQLTDVVIPAIAAALNPPPPTDDPLEDVMAMYATKEAYEAMLVSLVERCVHAVLASDSDVGSARFGPNFKAGVADGVEQSPTVKALQAEVTALGAAVAALTPTAPPS